MVQAPPSVGRCGTLGAPRSLERDRAVGVRSRRPLPAVLSGRIMKIRVRAAAVLILTVFLAARPFPARTQGVTVPLTVSLFGPQGGRVGIIPSGTLCDTPGPPSCTVSFDVGTVVRIVANGAVG